MLGEGGKEGSLCGCRILGIPSAGRTLSEAPGCFWELGRPAGLFSLIQREQEGLASELGWNFVQFLHEFRMVLGRAFRGHPIQFPAIIRDTFTRSGFSEPHPTLSTFSLVRKEFSIFPLQIQASIHIAPTSRAALPCHRNPSWSPSTFPLQGFSLSQHSGSSRKSTRRAGSSGADRIPSEMQGQALILRLRLCQGAGSSFPAGSLLQPLCPSPPPLFQPQRWREKKEPSLLILFSKEAKPINTREVLSFISKICE